MQYVFMSIELRYKSRKLIMQQSIATYYLIILD